MREDEENYVSISGEDEKLTEVNREEEAIKY